MPNLFGKLQASDQGNSSSDLARSRQKTKRKVTHMIRLLCQHTHEFHWWSVLWISPFNLKLGYLWISQHCWVVIYGFLQQVFHPVLSLPQDLTKHQVSSIAKTSSPLAQELCFQIHRRSCCNPKPVAGKLDFRCHEDTMHHRYIFHQSASAPALGWLMHVQCVFKLCRLQLCMCQKASWRLCIRDFTWLWATQSSLSHPWFPNEPWTMRRQDAQLKCCPSYGSKRSFKSECKLRNSPPYKTSRSAQISAWPQVQLHFERKSQIVFQKQLQSSI